MCNLYSLTTNQEAIIRLFRVLNRYVGNLTPMPGVFPDYPAPAIRNDQGEREMVMMRWGMPPSPNLPWPPVSHQHPQSFIAALARVDARAPA
jgi:putative SOS response-associated peptidase YedK